jgi:type I restriction enzyme S subunit
MIMSNQTIPVGWTDSPLGNLVDLIIDHRGKTPKKLGGDWSQKGYRAISAKTIKDGRLINEEQMNVLPDNLYKKWMKVEVQQGDIFLTSEAPLGEHIIWTSDEKIVLSQRIYGIRTNKKILDPYYFNYFIDSEFYQHELKSRESGTTVTGIRQTELLKTRVLVPPLPEQRAIAAVLSSLDDKIELLREQNKTLEATAQAIFKEWFGKYSPDRPEELPEGWRVGVLGQEMETFLGGTPAKNNKEFWENGSIAWINSGAVNDFRITKATYNITERAMEKSATKLLPKGTVVLAITGATLGQYSRLEIDSCFNQSVVGIKENKIFHSSFIYFWIAENIGNIIRNATGGAQQHINKEDINSTKFVIPVDQMLDSFYKVGDPIMDKISKNCFQIHAVSTLRDTLLPKLMRGEVRVKF